MFKNMWSESLNASTDSDFDDVLEVEDYIDSPRNSPIKAPASSFLNDDPRLAENF